MSDLPSVLAERFGNARPITLLFATVASPTPLRIVLDGGAEVTAKTLASYTPAGGDRVAVLASASIYLILGRLV